MTSDPSATERLRPIDHLGIVALYLGAVGLAALFLAPPQQPIVVWLPAGVAFAAVLARGPGVLPTVALAQLVAAMGWAIHLGVSPARMAMVVPLSVITTVAQAALGGFLVRRVITSTSAFDEPRDILATFVLGGPIACLVAAALCPVLRVVADLDDGIRRAEAWCSWQGDSLGVIVMTPVVLALLARPAGPWRRRRAIVAIPVVVCAAASYFSFASVLAVERTSLRDGFLERTGIMSARLRSMLELQTEALRSIDGLFDSSEHVTESEFHRFVTPLLARHGDLDLIGFAPREVGATGERWPLRYLETTAVVGHDVDLAASPAVAAAIAQARARGIATVSAPLPGAGARRHGRLLLVPVARQAPPELLGVAVARLRPRAVSAAARGDFPREWFEISLTEVDERGRQADGGLGSGMLRASLAELTSPLVSDEIVEIIGQRWRLRFVATPTYLAQEHDVTPWAVLASGLLFTALVGGFLLVGGGRSARVAALVEARTHELELANRMLRDEVALRRRSVKEAARHAEDLVRSNAEKEILLKEIHHRVKNNLQVISSLLSLQARQIAEPGARAAFHESQGRVRSMALLHEQIYRSGDLAQIDLGDYLRNVASTLIQAQLVDTRAVEITVESDGIKAEVDLAVSCGLLVNELLVNAIKYAFPDGRPGHVKVTASHRETGTEITIADDGVGLPADFDLTTAESFGLQLVVTLVEQLQGSITSGPAGAGDPAGACFRIELPRPKVGRHTPAPWVASMTPTPIPDGTGGPGDPTKA